MVIQFGTDSGSSYIVEFENSDRRKVVLWEDNSLELSQENIEYFYWEINKIFNKYSSNYVLEELFEAFKLDLEKEIKGMWSKPIIWKKVWEKELVEKVLKYFWLGEEGKKKLKSLFLFLEIEKQIDLDLEKKQVLKKWLKKLIALYNSNSKIKIEDNDDIKNQVEELKKIEKNNKFLESIWEKIGENERKQSNLEVYRGQLSKLKEEYSLDLFSSDFIELSSKYRKDFGQLYANAIDWIKNIDLDINNSYSEEKNEYTKYLDEKKEQKQKEIDKALKDEKNEKWKRPVKNAVLWVVLLAAASVGVSYIFWKEDVDIERERIGTLKWEKENYEKQKQKIRNEIQLVAQKYIKYKWFHKKIKSNIEEIVERNIPGSKMSNLFKINDSEIHFSIILPNWYKKIIIADYGKTFLDKNLTPFLNKWSFIDWVQDYVNFLMSNVISEEDLYLYTWNWVLDIIDSYKVSWLEKPKIIVSVDIDKVNIAIYKESLNIGNIPIPTNQRFKKLLLDSWYRKIDDFLNEKSLSDSVISYMTYEMNINTNKIIFKNKINIWLGKIFNHYLGVNDKVYDFNISSFGNRLFLYLIEESYEKEKDISKTTHIIEIPKTENYNKVVWELEY